MAVIKQAGNKPGVITLPGYKSARTDNIRRLVISLASKWRTGKTHFALTAPAPIAYLSMDTGDEGVIEKFAREKEIQVAEFDYRDSTNIEEWRATWEKCAKAYIDALESPRIRTVVWDTADEGYELLKMARFGKLNKIAMQDGKAVPFPYGPVNTEFRDLLRRALKTNKNIILIHKVKAEYVDDKRTGNYVRAGYAALEFLVQMDIATWYDQERQVFGLTVEDSRHNMGLAGLQLEEPLNNFPFLASQVFTDTTEEDWQ